MFDISWTEILVIGVVALIAIGPKELPRVLYEIGKGVRRLRAVAAEFHRHVNELMHETELEELRRQAQAARDLTNPRSLAEWVDPGGTLRYGIDPTMAGATGYPGSPVESTSPVVPAPVVGEGEAVAQSPHNPPPVGEVVSPSAVPSAVVIPSGSVTSSERG